MKVILVWLAAVAIVMGNAWGDDFQPSVLDIELPHDYYYFHEGYSDGFQIDIDVSGTPATAWMVINSREDADRIHSVQNGYLGWRYVNRINTTLYVSPSFHLDVGEQSIAWDGKGLDGKYLTSPFVEGQMCGNVNPYNLYIWGYASDSQRVPVCDFVQVSHGMADRHVSIIDYDKNGIPLEHPFLFGSDPGTGVTEGVQYYDSNIFFEWTLGADPTDSGFLATTQLSEEHEYYPRGIFSAGDIYYPDQSSFIVCVTDTAGLASTVQKWEFVPDGEAIFDENWGGWDNMMFKPVRNADGSTRYPALSTNSEFIWIHGFEESWRGELLTLVCLDRDGEVIFECGIPGHDGNVNETQDNPGNHILQYIVPANRQLYRDQRLLALNATSCLIQMIDPGILLEDGGYSDKEDIILWENGNGDFFLDMNFFDDLNEPWGCVSNDPAVSHIKTAADVDANGFSVIWTDFRGLVSFGVLAPDGKGVGYGTYADEIIPDASGSRWGGQIVDTGSNFDGMYIVNTEPQSGRLGTSFVGFDCAEGYIEYVAYSDQPTAVSENMPRAITLHQNTPNPFNPSTAISFVLPEDGHVLLTVYNIAGQQVATVHDGDLSAGEHSVRWDADGFPAGVYFYTLACGEFSRTMKMTLVK